MKRNPLVSRLSSMAIATVMVLAGSWFNPSAAELLSIDDSVFGADSVTLDTETGLEWLDNTLTRNRSFYDLALTNAFSPGGEFAGWGYADTNQVIGYFDNAGIRDSLTGTTGFELLTPVEDFSAPLLNFLDLTAFSFNNGIKGWFKALDGVHYGNASAQINYEPLIDDGTPTGCPPLCDRVVVAVGSRIDPSVGVITNNFSSYPKSSSQGSWLVRSAPLTTVPLPAALPLFLTGLAGLVLMRRRKRQA